MPNPSTPLTPSQAAALERLEQSVGGDEEVIAREEAVDYLIAGEFEQPEAHDLIEQLLLKGYLYETETGLRITG